MKVLLALLLTLMIASTLAVHDADKQRRAHHNEHRHRNRHRGHKEKMMDTTIYLGGEVPEDILELEDNTENMASSTVTTAEPVSTPVPSEVSREHNNKKLAKSQ